MLIQERENGVIRQLEMPLGRPIQWIICILHLNELNFRAAFDSIDGGTCGTKSFKGPIDFRLNFEPSALLIVRFKRIFDETDTIPDKYKSDLSQDQIYLLCIANVICLGFQSSDLCELNYLTTASPGNRILRYDIGTETPSTSLSPSTSLISIISYILNAPSWFRIKTHRIWKTVVRISSSLSNKFNYFVTNQYVR